MKTLKSVLVAAFLLVAGFSFAQRPGGQQGPPPLPSDEQIETMVSELAEEIDLNEDQETKILALYKEHFEEVKEKVSAGRPDRDEMEEIKEEFEQKVEAELTDEQVEKFEAYQKKQQGNRRRN